MTGRRQPPAKAVRQRPVELQTPTETTARFDPIAVGRELRMISKLEQEVNDLCERHGEAARYPLPRKPAKSPMQAESPSVPPGINPVPLESVLCTEELKRRPIRPPDYATENCALATLAQALADSPSTILQTLADTILETFHADSAGISLLTADAKRFYWPAIAGMWQPHIGGVTPRDFGPCGDVLDCNGPLLFKRPERRYTYFIPVTPLCEECLLVPIYVKGEAVGTIWAIAHDDLRKFDAEDLRQLESLGRFASAAYQATESLDVALEHRRAAHSLMEDALQSSQTMQRVDREFHESEAFNRSIVESSPDCIKVLDVEGILLSMQNGRALLGIEDIRPFLNKSWIEFWTDDADRKAARTAIAAAAAGGEGNFVGFFRTLRGEAKWWDVRISPILDAHRQPARLLAVSRDVTARRQAEFNFECLAAISHDLLRLTGIDEMMQTVGAKIGSHLELSLCAFVEIDETAEQVVINHEWRRADVPSLVGVHRLADFVEGEFLRLARAGEIIVVRDTAADARTTPEKFAALKIASFICAPLIRDEQWRFALCLYRSEACAWRADEIELARELTVRIWTRLERLRAEQALRESQRFLRSSIDALSGHMAVLDEAGNILEVNAAWRRFADENQFTLPDYGIGSNYLQVCEETLPQQSEAPAYAGGIEDVIAGRRAHFEIEYPCHSPTEQRWFIMRVTRFQSPGPVRVVIVHDNISARKRAEDELRQTEARFRLMADSAPVLIWLSGTDKLCFWFNKTWLDYTGRSMEQEIGNGWAENVHPADLDHCLQTYAAAFDARAPLSMEYRLKSRDGEYRWFLDIGIPRFAADHEFSGYIGSCTDISEVKQAQDAVRASEQRYRTLFELGPVAVYTIDTSGAIQNFNRHAAELWGRTPALGDIDERFCGSHKLFRADGSFMPHDQTPMAEVVAGKIPAVHDVEVCMERPDGSRVTVIVNIRPLTNERGEITGAINCFYDITGRKRVEDALRESEARYRDLFTSMDEGYCTIEMIFDEQGKPVDYRYLEINPSFEKLTGMHGALGKRISEFVPDLEAHWYETYGKVALTGEPIRVADEVKGMNRWFDLYAFRVGRPGRRQVAILFRNITERKQAERQTEMLSNLSRELAGANEEAEIVAIAVEAVGRHLNGHRCYFVECLADENRLLVSHNWVRDEAPSIEGELSLFDFGGLEWWREFAGGDFIMEDVATNPLTQANSANYHAVGVPSYAVQPFRRDADWTVCLTVTEKSPRKWTAYDLRILSDVVARVWPLVERARADRALRESEAQLRLTLDSAELGTWTFDPETNAITTDARFRAIFGVTGEDFSFEQGFTLVHPDDRDTLRDKVAASVRPDDPVPYEAEYRVLHPDGSLHWVFAKGRANLGHEPAGGRLLSLDGTIADITGRKRVDEALRESAQTLADLGRRKDEFLAMLSHELRNPLAPIANALQLLRLQKNEDPLQRQARTLIERQVGQLNRLVDDLLEVSRITTGRVQLRRDRVAMSGIVERAVETSHPLFVQRRHELTVSAPPQPIWVHADAARLEQVVVNLLTNAAKYTDEGGHIWLTIEQEGDSAVLRVRDTGIGISPELLPHIFELFTQAERSLDRSQGGLGIGLCLVQRLVDLHGGTVEVYSVLGQGSEFVVRLPVMLTALPPALSAPLVSALPPAKSCRVLVVDDNVDAAQSLAMLLEMFDHDVQVAYDGPSALAAALAVRPDVMLLDIGLPGLTGHEVARRIREHAALKNIVLIAMTGYGQEADRQSSLNAGFDHHLVKPADFAEVQRILAAVCNDG